MEERIQLENNVYEKIKSYAENAFNEAKSLLKIDKVDFKCIKEYEDNQYIAMYFPQKKMIQIRADLVYIETYLLYKTFSGKSFEQCKQEKLFGELGPDLVAFIKASSNDSGPEFGRKYIKTIIFHEMRHAYQHYWVSYNTIMESIGGSPRAPRHWRKWRRELAVTGKERWTEADANAYAAFMICPDVAEEDVGPDVYNLIKEMK